MRNTFYVSLNGRLGNQLFIWNYAHILSDKGKQVILFGDDQSIKILDELNYECNHNISITKSRVLPFLFSILDYLNSRCSYLADFFAELFLLRTEEVFVRDKKKRHVLRHAEIWRGYFQDLSLVEAGFHKWKNEVDRLRIRFIDSEKKHHPGDCSNTAIHVRRGDYVRAKNIWGLLSPDFYNQQIKRREKVCCFSDEKLDASFIENIDGKLTEIPPETMSDWVALFSLAAHKKIIISNSTFSWWAAFLSMSNGGQIYMPSKWFLSDPSSVLRYAHPGFKLIEAKYEK